MDVGRVTWSAFRFAAAVLAAYLSANPVSADEAIYRVRRGDTLEVSIAGLPELTKKALIDQGGYATLPLIGLIKLDGLSISEAQVKVRTALSSKVAYTKSPDGRKIPYIIDSDEVLLSVAEYRPVYASGDVPHPGQQEYIPGMRVRNVLSLASNQEGTSIRFSIDLANVFDFESTRDTLWLDLAKAQAQAWRVKAELDNRRDASVDDLIKHLPPIDGAAAVARSEADLLALQMADWAKETAYLQSDIEKSTRRASELSQQFTAESQGSAADSEEYDRMQHLLDRNLTSQNRVTDSRRAMLISATRSLQTGVQLATAQRERDDRIRALERSTDERRAGLLQALEDAQVNMTDIKSKIQAIERKIAYLGTAMRPLLATDASKLKIVIMREGAAGVESIQADENTPVEPGDVINVSYARSSIISSASK
jgi:polysaccharide export outer membrane protein